METLTCPVCKTDFTATEQAPAHPVDIGRPYRRSITRSRELICHACATTRPYPAPPEGIFHVTWPRYDSTTSVLCEGCETMIAVPDNPRRKHIYCSNKCRQAILRRQAPRDRSRECDTCGNTFTGRAGAKYCSPACRQKAYRARQP